MSKRSIIEIKARCLCILDDEGVVFLVKESGSPTAAHEMILAVTKSQEKAKGGRWLAVLRRDHPAEYRQLICERGLCIK